MVEQQSAPNGECLQVRRNIMDHETGKRTKDVKLKPRSELRNRTFSN